jgi:hypothetical protein
VLGKAHPAVDGEDNALAMRVGVTLPLAIEDGVVPAYDVGEYDHPLVVLVACEPADTMRPHKRPCRLGTSTDAPQDSPVGCSNLIPYNRTHLQSVLAGQRRRSGW